MSRPDFLSQLPSLEELLENPRVAAAVDRVNRSAAATQVRTAVARLGSEIARRTDELKGLGAGELFDRLMRQLEQPTPSASPQVINATGQFFGLSEGSTPLAASALDAATSASAGFRFQAGKQASAAAARLLGCDKAAVLSSPVAALAVTLEALAAGGACVVARGEMAELSPGVRLDEVAHRSGVRLIEVGATDSSTVEDFETAIAGLRSEGAERLVVLKRLGDVGSNSPETESLAACNTRHDAPLIVDAGGAPPNASVPTYGFEGLTAHEVLGSGADVVVVDTSGRIGGPVGAIAAGQGAAIDKIEASTAAAADRMDPLVEETLLATLAMFEQPDQLRFTHPLYQLLDAPIENLRVRSERMARLIGEADEVASAEAVEEATTERPSWAVRIEPTPGATAADLQARLAGQDPRIEVATAGSAIVLNLATVFASEDRALIEAFVPTVEGDALEQGNESG